MFLMLSLGLRLNVDNVMMRWGYVASCPYPRGLTCGTEAHAIFVNPLDVREATGNHQAWGWQLVK